MRAGRACLSIPAAAAAAALASAGGATAQAQSPKPMTLVDITTIPRIQDAQLSPDGRFVSYMLVRPDWKADAYVPHIWRQAVSGGEPVQLTKDDGESLARWSPDSSTLAYWSKGQLFLVPAAGGTRRQLTHHATDVVQMGAGGPGDPAVAWSADGRSIYFLARDPRTRRPEATTLVAFEETDFEQLRLWKVGVATGAEQQVTSGDWSVISYRLSRDGRHATLLRSSTPLTIDHYRSDVWLLDLESGAIREVTHNGIYETEADLSPDGSQLYFVADANQDLDVYYGASLFVVPAAGGTPRRVSPQAAYSVDQAAWAPDGKSILAVANMGVHSEIVRVDVATGATTPLTNGEHFVIPGWTVVAAADRMVFQLDEPTRLGDAWTLPIAGGAPTRVTGIYDTLGRDFALPRQEKLTWKGADGATVEGLLFYPIGYQPGRRYPLIVQLHGGPGLSDKFGYGPGFLLNYVPVLAAKGYAVFRPNYRGSAGYGPDFVRDIVGHYFHNMHLDVLAGIDALVARGIVDPDRLAVSGWSAGGTLVNKLVTFTDRFKAASSGAGVSDWISMMAQTDAVTRRTFWFGGTPWDPHADLDTFLNQSPIRDVAKVKTPTIFFVGERDARVPQPQSQEMYRGLEHNAVPTKLFTAPGEPHDAGGWRPRHTFDKANLELAWFEKYVTGRPYQLEAPPAGMPAPAR